MLLLLQLQIPNDLLILDSYIADPERSGKTDFLHMTHFIECLCSDHYNVLLCVSSVLISYSRGFRLSPEL